jgi:SMODS-associating 2TM, beta-strand rich effector domain
MGELPIPQSSGLRALAIARKTSAAAEEVLMLRALSLDQIIWIFATPSIVVFAIIALIRERHWRGLFAKGNIGLLIREAFSAATAAVTFVGLGFAVLNYTAWWREAWKLEFTNTSVFPDLNGMWHGSLSSNVKNEASENGDCPWLDPNTSKSFGCYHIDMTIEMSLFDTDVRLKLGDARSESKGVTLIRDGGDYKLMYLFIRTHPFEPTFNGAAILEARFQNSLLLEGHYWTDREWVNTPPPKRRWLRVTA